MLISKQISGLDCYSFSIGMLLSGNAPVMFIVCSPLISSALPSFRP